MHQLQGWPIRFPDGKKGLCIVQTTFRTVRIGITTNLKRLVVDPSAFLKLVLKDTPLAVGEIDAVFEGFSHGLSIRYDYLKHNVCSNQSGGLKPLKLSISSGQEIDL
jgi:hypothetical protein